MSLNVSIRSEPKQKKQNNKNEIEIEMKMKEQRLEEEQEPEQNNSDPQMTEQLAKIDQLMDHTNPNPKTDKIEELSGTICSISTLAAAVVEKTVVEEKEIDKTDITSISVSFENDSY